MNRLMVPILSAAQCAVWMLVPAAAHAQKMPTIDANGQLGTAAVGDRRVHAVVDFNIQNGDFSRGKYDDDAANLDRLPIAISLALSWQIHENGNGTSDVWIEASSENGFHSPIAIERNSPRAWYDNNNVLALVYKPTKSMTAALSYAIKTSPNGASSASNEMTTALGFQTETGIGWLRPSAAISIHTKGGSGVYTLFGLNPTIHVLSKENGPAVSVPARFGVGWDGFYGNKTGTAAYGSIGIAYAHPFSLGPTQWRLRAQILALVRDHTVRSLGNADAEHSSVVPLATLGISLTY